MKSPDRHQCRKIFSAALVLLLLNLLIGCSPRLSPEEVIASAIDAIPDVQTYRIELTATITQDEEMNQVNIQWEFVSPDRLHMITVKPDGTEESVTIGNTEYRRDPGSNSWEVEQRAESLPPSVVNPAVAVAESLESLVGLVELPSEKIDGVSCYHYKGSVDTEAQVEEQKANLDPSQPDYEEQLKAIEQQPQWEESLEFWVGKEDCLLRRVEVRQNIVYIVDWDEDSGREVQVQITAAYRLFDFNQPVQIEPPTVE